MRAAGWATGRNDGMSRIGAIARTGARASAAAPMPTPIPINARRETTPSAIESVKPYLPELPTR